MAHDDAHSILQALEEERCRALLACDMQALQALCSERLVYTHTSTRRENKTAYLERVACGFYRYLSFSRGPLAITVIGSTALINSTLTSEVTVDGVAKTLRNDVLVVWAHEGDRWRFAAYQPTPIPAAPATATSPA